MPTAARSLLVPAGATVVATALGLAGIFGLFEWRTNRLRVRHEELQRQRASAWMLETGQRKAAARQADQERFQKQHEELIAAFGGPVASAARNPALTIAGMIRSVADQCAGGRRGISVAVDRFTEFTLTIALDALETPSPSMSRSPAQLTGCVLPQIGSYLHRLRFTRRGVVVAELDRHAIESIPDWSHASPETVQAMLNNERLESEATLPAVNSSAQRDPDDERNLTRRERLQKDAWNDFHRAFTNSIGKVLLAVRHQDSSINMAEVRGSSDLSSRQDFLRASERLLTDARAFFSNPSDMYRQVLKATGLDATFIDATLQSPGFEKSIQASLMLAVIDRAQARNQEAARVLEVMRKSLGSWNYLPETGQIQFIENPAAAASYGEAIRQVDRETIGFNAALTRWTTESKP